MRRRKGEKVLRPVWPNAGIAAIYRRKLRSLIASMQASYVYFLKAQYRALPPVMATDASPARELEAELKRLGVQWQRKFNDAAPALAAWFAQVAAKRSDAALRRILKDAGISVEFRMTKAMRDILNATMAQNVSLIKSIGSQYHTEVEGLVMRSVTEGRDLGFLSKELKKRYGITDRRAAFISLDQNNKATSMMMAARQTDLGIEEGTWLHSGAGKHPRPSHVRNSGKRFNIKDGWPDPALKGKRIWPGTEPNCRCTWKPVIFGFS
jgi:SPP1 gp7 family putative phage head morphogenesis protein